MIQYFASGIYLIPALARILLVIQYFASGIYLIPALASILLVIQYFASGIYLIFVIFFAKQKQKSRQKIVLVRS